MRKQSEEARTTKYWMRAIGRITRVLITLFILFLVVAGMVYLAPKIWQFAISG